jgi:hypothetical protein
MAGVTVTATVTANGTKVHTRSIPIYFSWRKGGSGTEVHYAVPVNGGVWPDLRRQALGDRHSHLAEIVKDSAPTTVASQIKGDA